jgi:hypothetical protein
MNLRERLQIRGLVNLIISVLERLVNLIIKLSPKPKIDNLPVNKPHRPKPLKKVVDTIDNIVPLPWRKKDE